MFEFLKNQKSITMVIEKLEFILESCKNIKEYLYSDEFASILLDLKEDDIIDFYGEDLNEVKSIKTEELLTLLLNDDFKTSLEEQPLEKKKKRKSKKEKSEEDLINEEKKELQKSFEIKIGSAIRSKETNELEEIEEFAGTSKEGVVFINNQIKTKTLLTFHKPSKEIVFYIIGKNNDDEINWLTLEELVVLGIFKE